MRRKYLIIAAILVLATAIGVLILPSVAAYYCVPVCNLTYKCTRSCLKYWYGLCVSWTAWRCGWVNVCHC